MSEASTARRPGFTQGIMLLLPMTMAVMGIVLLVPVLPEIMREFQGIPGSAYFVQLGILTMPAGCVLLFSPLAGTLADRYGRRSLLIKSMVVYAFMGVAPMFLSSMWAIIATRIGVGICEAVIMTASTTMISDYFRGAARERWLASQTAVASLSALALFQVAGWLGSAYGWRGPFAAYLFSLVLVLGVVAFTWESARDPLPAAANVPTAAGTPMPWRRLLSLCALTVLAAIMFYTYQTQAGIALDALGIHDASQRGTAAMIASMGVPLGTVLFWLVSRLNIAALLFLEFLLIGASYHVMGQATDVHGFTIAAFANQLGCGLILPTMLTWTTYGLAFDIRGRCTGWWTGSFASGQFLSGGVVTLLAAMLGGPLKALSALGSVSLVAAACALLAFVYGWSTGAAGLLRQR
jgi:MFS family permease